MKIFNNICTLFWVKQAWKVGEWHSDFGQKMLRTTVRHFGRLGFWLESIITEFINK